MQFRDADDEAVESFLDFAAKNGVWLCRWRGDGVYVPEDRGQILADFRASVGMAPKWDPEHDAMDVCRCGHHYCRHFDGYEGNRAVGCKYCGCSVFESAGHSD